MMATLLTLASVPGIAVGFGLAAPEQCQGTLGAFCDSDTPYGSICVTAIPGLGSGYPGNPTVSCAPGSKVSKGNPEYAFCSSLTSRVAVPVMQADGSPITCKSKCLNSGAYCDIALKTCAVPVSLPTEKQPYAKEGCTDFGQQANCAKGQICSPTLSQCVTVGAQCVAKNKNSLMFAWVNSSTPEGVAITPTCGEVDAGPRMPNDLFALNNTASLKYYIDLTRQNYKFPFNSHQYGYLTQTTCKQLGYTKSAGSKTATWAPESLMQNICRGNCNCAFPDCPDVPDDPGFVTGFGPTPRFCSLCGPKFNAPIKINLYKKK